MRVPRGPVTQRITCPSCGRRLRVEYRPTQPGRPAAACPVCSRPVPRGAALCTHCGTDLRTGRRQMTKVRGGVRAEVNEIYSWVWWVSLILPFAVVPYKSTAGTGKSHSANRTLVLATIVVSLVALLSLWTGDQRLLDSFALWPGPKFALEQLVSHVFLHGGVAHLAGNMVFLWMFGTAINGVLGGVAYPAAYLALGALSGFLGHVLPASAGPGVPLVGASGAICGLTGLYLVLFPRHDIHMAVWFRLFWWTPPYIRTFPLTGIYAVLIFTAFDVVAVLSGSTGNVAHWVHLAGFACGVVLGLVLLLGHVVRSEGYDLLTWLMGDRWRTR